MGLPKKYSTLLLFFAAVLVPFCSKAQSVEYRVTFTGTWTANDSSSYPFSAHFSDLVGVTHPPGNPFWKSGNLATQGVEDVAELGFNSALESELRADSQNGPIVTFSSLFQLPNSDTLELTFDPDKPNITLISMVAPSPDWFVGVSDLSLRNNGQWIQSLSVDLHPYDAGTEDGDTFSLSNPETVPQQPVALLGSSPFFQTNPVIGRLDFELLTPIEPPAEPPSPPPAPSVNKPSISATIQLLLSD